MLDAALATLKTQGFAGTSARAIASAGGFNQALIFYHFGSVNGLLLAALDETSRRRQHAYERAVADASSLEEMIEVARRIYREDLDSGHITVLSEMIAGSLTHPELAQEIVARLEPWIDFAQRAIARALVGSPLEGIVPSADLAFAVVSFYLGADLLTQLEGNRSRVERLFETAAGLTPLLTALAGGAAQ